MDSRALVWITRDEAEDLGIKGDEFPLRILDINSLIYTLLRDGSPRDIAVLPFLRNFGEILGYIRGRGISGPVIICTKGEIVQLNLLDYAAQGVIFLDSSRLSRHMALGLIAFLQRQQEFVQLPEQPLQADRTQAVKPSQSPEEIRPLFREITRQRAKILLTCQFRDDLPTLTATCDVIQMAGEIETRLVLDNFSPEEFVGLYNQFGKGKPITGFFTRGDESMGFDLTVSSCRMGRITALLPERIYEQKRKFLRVEPDPRAPVIIHILPDGYRTVSLPVRDVSEQGVGIVSTYTEMKKSQVCPVALVLPSRRTLLGTAAVMFKGDIEGGSCSYGMSLMLHPSDRQQLQHYVFKRQAGILSSMKNLSL